MDKKNRKKKKWNKNETKASPRAPVSPVEIFDYAHRRSVTRLPLQVVISARFPSVSTMIAPSSSVRKIDAPEAR
jgi:hypothetical protein